MFADACADYRIGIEAVAGHRFIEDPVTLECVQTPTGTTQSEPFWGWHTSPIVVAAAPAVQTSLSTGAGVCVGGPSAGFGCTVGADCLDGVCDEPWLYGPWTPVLPTCSVHNMAFELLADVPRVTADCNFNRVPDECEFCVSSAPREVKIADSGLADPLTTLTTNRTLIIQAGGDVGCPLQAIRVTLDDVAAPYDLWNGQQLWVGTPVLTSEAGSTPIPTPASANNFWARLQCSSECRDDWATFGNIHVYHEGVVPGSSYEIQVVDCTDPRCLAQDSIFSFPLRLNTSAYGDTLRDCIQIPCAPPEGPPVNVNDALGVLKAFSSSLGAPRKARTDIEPADLDRVINVSDALEVIRAFSGLPYPFAPSAPHPCP